MSIPAGPQGPQAGGPPISPDGHYWWDGQAWQPMPVAAPAPPPQLAGGAPPPNQPAGLEQPPAWLAAPPEAAAPMPPPEQVEQPAPTPAWATPQPPASRMWIYMTGFLMIAILVIGGFVVYPMVRPSANITASVQVSPSPLISDYERADRFLNVDLAPSLASTNVALPAVTSKCTSSLPPPCKDALIALDKAMGDVDQAMINYQRDIPVCIGRAVQQFKDDWTGMEQGVALAVSGYDANSRALIIEGLQKFAAIAKFVKPDVDRINKAELSCSKTV